MKCIEKGLVITNADSTWTTGHGVGAVSYTHLTLPTT